MCGETRDLIAPATAAGVVSDLLAPFLAALAALPPSRLRVRFGIGSTLLALGRVGFAVAGDELDAEPAEDVIDEALGVRDVRVLRVARRLEAGVRELVHEDLAAARRIAGSSDVSVPMVVHQAADGAAFLGHGDEQLAGPAVLEQADGDVALVAGDVELVRERLARVGQAAARRLEGPPSCASALFAGGQRLALLRAVAIDGQGLEPQPPAFEVGSLDVLDGRFLAAC